MSIVSRKTIFEAYDTIRIKTSLCSPTDPYHKLKILDIEKRGTKLLRLQTIKAHLTASHQNILNSSQVKDSLNWSRQLTPLSMVGCGRISNSFETI